MTALVADRIWRNARIATMATDAAGPVRLDRGAVAAKDGRIAWVGAMDDLPPGLEAHDTIEMDGRWMTPGLIDCHTHLVHGGDRAREFEMRLEGADYQAIAQAGGGILSTVRATRSASAAELGASALRRLDALIAEGVTTVEIKSGYALDLAGERRMLETARDLGTRRDVTVLTTFLALHALPPEAAGDRDGFVRLMCEEALPTLAAAGLVDAVDAFCESIAFTPEETARLFATAAALGLPVKLHADQLSNLQGARLAAAHGAISAEHLEYTDEDGAAAMARAGTVAVLLPGAFYTLRETKLPPIAAFRRHGTAIAIATDYNPGTSPVTSILTIMNMAATLFRLTVDECLAGVTREAARALGRLADTGTIETGKWCDLAIWDIESPAELVYRVGFNPLHRRIWRGR